jgi:flagellar motor switch protein FliN/FliY
METPDALSDSAAGLDAAPSEGGEIAGEAALVPSLPPLDQQECLNLNPRLGRLAVELDVAIPIREFRVRDLLALEPGRVVKTEWQQGEDMPLAARGTQLAWSEFEVINSRLAVRVTRLA